MNLFIAELRQDYSLYLSKRRVFRGVKFFDENFNGWARTPMLGEDSK